MTEQIYIRHSFTCNEVGHEFKCSDDEHIHLECGSNLVDGILGDVVHTVVADLCKTQHDDGKQELCLGYRVRNLKSLRLVKCPILKILVFELRQ